MENWKKLKIEGISIEKVVGLFEVWAVNKIPFAKFRVKILEKTDGNFIGIANIRLKNLNNNMPEGEAGFGKNPCEALQDAIERLMKEVDERQNLVDEDFEWADPEDF
jgi:hypothetical protein